MTSKYSFVTVAFLDELGFMHLQARSMQRYLPRDLIEEIVVIENTPPALPTIWRERLRSEFGPLRDLVKFVPAEQIASFPSGIGGWFSQQVLKLKIAERVTAQRYVILDAKNHFVFPLTRTHLEANGKPRAYVHGYQNHPLRVYLQPILAYYGLPAEHANSFLPTITPFCADAGLVRETISDLQRRTQKPFVEAFCKSSIRFTEFFTIGAYILSRGRQFEDYYDISGVGQPVIWAHDAANEAKVQAAVVRSETHQTPVFSVHRRGLPTLTDKSRRHLAAFWQRRGLFQTEQKALDYLTDPNRGLQ